MIIFSDEKIVKIFHCFWQEKEETSSSWIARLELNNTQLGFREIISIQHQVKDQVKDHNESSVALIILLTEENKDRDNEI